MSYPEGNNARNGGPGLNGLILLSLMVHFIVLIPQQVD